MTLESEKVKICRPSKNVMRVRALGIKGGSSARIRQFSFKASMLHFIIDAQGYTDSLNKFIFKEVAVIACEADSTFGVLISTAVSLDSHSTRAQELQLLVGTQLSRIVLGQWTYSIRGLATDFGKGAERNSIHLREGIAEKELAK